MEEKAFRYLEQDALNNIDMLEALRRGMAKLLYAEEDGVLLQVKDTAMLCTTGVETAARLVEHLPEQTAMLVAHEEHEKQLWEQRWSAKNPAGSLVCNPCRFAVYTGQEAFPQMQGFAVQQLGKKYTEAVLKQYHLFHDPEYIAERMEAGVFYGAFLNDELAGFIGEHSEGSIGMLEVYPKFRRRGVASALEAEAIRRAVSDGRTPYGDIILDNTASFAVQRALGLALSAKVHYWLSV